MHELTHSNVRAEFFDNDVFRRLNIPNCDCSENSKFDNEYDNAKYGRVDGAIGVHVTYGVQVNGFECGTKV